MPTDFTLPELGEQIAGGDVLRVLVKPGDRITKDQPVLELETDKATIEVPSSVAGLVKDVKVTAGDKVTVGQVVLTVDDDAAGAEEKAPAPASPAAAPPPEGSSPRRSAPGPTTAAVPEDQPETGQPVEGRKRPTGGPSGATGPEPDSPAATDAPSASPSQASPKVVDINRGVRPTVGHAPPDVPVAPAAPSVRRMARELGVDVNQVAGTGTSGRISIEDVKAHAKRLVSGLARGVAAGVAVQAVTLPDFTRWGEVDRQPMGAVRRKTAEHLSAAWATIPHVTQHDVADITGLEDLRRRYSKEIEATGGNLTVTAIAVKIVAAALKVFPQFNSSIDLATNEIIYKKFVNIGIAVDTDRGLLVPVIRDADAKNISQLSVELLQLSEKARTRKIALDEMQGGCFSISNLGGIGGSFFTPIVNAPEVAILGISRARMAPVFSKETDQFVPRLMLPLSLSYDHRVIDGADGIRFLRWVVDAFEQPFLLSLQG